MKKLLIVFGLLLLLGVAMEAFAQEEVVLYKPLCISEKGLNNLVDVINKTTDEDEMQKAIDADCVFEPVLVIIGDAVGTVTLRGRTLNIREVLVLGLVRKDAILALPQPVVMYGTFPPEGNEI